MKKHIQTLLVKEHGHGNCYQTTLACLLDVEPYQVPDIALFFKIKPLEHHWFDLLQSWLKQVHGLREMNSGELDDYHKNLIPFPEKFKDIPYMVSGISPRNINHVVIYMNGKMIHDTHPEQSGLLETELFTCTYLELCNP